MGKSDLRKAGPVVALVMLSLLWACSVLWRDLLPGLAPDLLPPMERQSVPFALLALVAGTVAVLRKAGSQRGWRLWNSLTIALGLFIIPAWLIWFAESWIPSLARTALLTLVPVFALVLEPYIGEPYIGRDTVIPQNRSRLLAALLAFAGALCVFPVATPASAEAALAFCAAIAAAACIAAGNCKAVAMAHESACSVEATAALAGAIAAIAFAASSAVLEQPTLRWGALRPELLWAAAIELPALLLLFWLMRHMQASSMATRYVIAPLIAIVTGAASMRAALAPRTWMGLVLMAAASVYLLMTRKSEPESIVLPLH